MGAMMQGFYWNCHDHEGKVEAWWNHVAAQIPDLTATGFTGLWLPPAHKADARHGMGYDPFDYFDLGEFDQRGGTATGFGTRAHLETLITTAHQHGLQVYADVVYNHCSGGDEEPNSDTGSQYWTSFDPASGKFPRDFRSFNPSRFESYDGHQRFGGFPDLCHRNPEVYRWLLEHARFLVEDIGFDGFRFDLVKGYGTWIITALMEYRYRPKNDRARVDDPDIPYFRPFGVGESWSGDRAIDEWLDAANSWSDNPVSAFDFPLRYRLKDLCDKPGYSLRQLVEPGTVAFDRSERAVTFVDNHDFRGGDHPEIINDKMLAYAVILTHQGYPCVYWRDYFAYGLALTGEPSGIAALVSAHGRHAGGGAVTRHVDDHLYIMERLGKGDQRGLVLVINNRDHGWHGAWVDTAQSNTFWQPVAWRGKADLNTPLPTWSGSDGRAEFWAPPRGYVVYVPG